MAFGVCVLRDSDGHPHGVVRLRENEDGGCTIVADIQGMTPGHHGFHVHRSGNEISGAHSLCAHYNPLSKTHGDLNDPHAHMGDLGNLYFDASGRCVTKFTADYLMLTGPYSVLGRSLVVHADPDDLGLGNFPDSKTTGHSGDRILFGIIGLDEPCDS